MFRHESWQLAKLPVDNPPYSQMGAHSLLVAVQPAAAEKPPVFAQMQHWRSAWVIDGRDTTGPSDVAWVTPNETRSLEQRHGWNAWQAAVKIELVVPQGCAGPKSAEALHALLNAVPEMQHWPSGNDIARCAFWPGATEFRFPPQRGHSHSAHAMGARGLPSRYCHVPDENSQCRACGGDLFSRYVLRVQSPRVLQFAFRGRIPPPAPRARSSEIDTGSH